MLGFAWPELLLIGVVAVVVIGPKDLPPLMRRLGVWTRTARSMVAELRSHLDTIPHQVDVAAMQKQVDALQKAGYKHFNIDLDAPAAPEKPPLPAHAPASTSSAIEAMSADDTLVER